MRFASVSAIAAGCAVSALAGGLTPEERVELIRGLNAEYATVKSPLPRSKKPLPFDSKGTWDKEKWDAAEKQFGQAARAGDLIQITKVTLEDDRILLEINGGLRTGPKWHERIQVGTGRGVGPISQGSNPTAGSNLVILYHQKLPSMKAADVKKLLTPVMDFEKRSATQLYAESLPPEIQQAIKEKKALDGMNREQVVLSLGQPVRKQRETKEGVELEDWIYGTPPGRIVFVTFSGSKVVKVKESYAGLGLEAAPDIRTP